MNKVKFLSALTVVGFVSTAVFILLNITGWPLFFLSVVVGVTAGVILQNIWPFFEL
jgi:hypothetical protein